MLQYFGDGTPLKGGTLAIGDDFSASRFFQMKTKVVKAGKNNSLEGRISVSEELARSIAAAEGVGVEAPNEMGEEWHLGAASPLKRVIHDCR